MVNKKDLATIAIVKRVCGASHAELCKAMSNRAGSPTVDAWIISKHVNDVLHECCRIE